ncbi:hypothetical protein, partial [Aliikangiella coralliicola]|uniref:hypothetical protein n=1 Tax=Aliikangiella coralliicola TaxID=2592383 RepID=UPI001AEF7601
MAEAYGSIILNAGKLNEELKLCKVKLNWELIEKLLNMTSISYECNPNLARFDIRGSEFLFENKILINEKYNRFEIFGDE